MKARLAGKPKKFATPGISPAGRIRAYLAGAIVTLGILGVASRAYSLQIDQGDAFAEQAIKQHAMTIDLPGPRGEIVDVHGEALAVSADADSIWANPREIADVTDVAAKLAPILGRDAGALEGKIGADKRFVWLDRLVTAEVAAQVKAAKLRGVYVAKEPRRWYPSQTIAGPIVGRADIDGVGMDGIELAMNDLLAGKKTAQKALRDARGRRMYSEGLSRPEPGATIQLTLDRSIQAISDAALAETVASHNPKSGVVVVLDVATGKVLALSTYPVSNPNSPDAPARNRPVTDAFESGSVMKIFTVASALDEGIVSPDTEFELTPIPQAPKVRDVDRDPYLDVTGIIRRSSNIGAAKIGLRLGRDTLYARLQRFGFGMKTGIELPGESAGSMRAGSKWRDIELATIAFGYGLRVTPIQIAAGLAAIGNGGIYHPPRIVDQAVDPDGTVLYSSAVEERRVVSEKTAAQMMKILESPFDKDPTGKRNGTAATIVVPGFKCAGKTGTAHKWDSEAKKYSETRYLSSFAGLAPAGEPKIAIVVMIDEPSNGDHFGAKVAGPVFASVASETLRYLGVPGGAMPPPMAPDEDGIMRPIPTPRATFAEYTAAMNRSILSPVWWNTEPDSDDREFVGLGYARALALAHAKGLAVEVKGTGCVVEQDISGSRVSLTFADGCHDR